MSIRDRIPLLPRLTGASVSLRRHQPGSPPPWAAADPLDPFFLEFVRDATTQGAGNRVPAPVSFRRVESQRRTSVILDFAPEDLRYPVLEIVDESRAHDGSDIRYWQGDGTGDDDDDDDDVSIDTADFRDLDWRRPSSSPR